MYTNVPLSVDTLMSTNIFEKTGNHPVFNLIMHKGCQTKIADISNILTIARAPKIGKQFVVGAATVALLFLSSI